MTPASSLRDALAEARRGGIDFDTVWLTACAAAAELPRTGRERDAWRNAFEATRPAWQRAYLGADPHPAEHAAGVLIRARELEPLGPRSVTTRTRTRVLA